MITERVFSLHNLLYSTNMNFISRAQSETGPRLMKHADLVIIYERHDSLNHIYLSRGEILNNKFGAFYHDDLIGKPFGSKIVSRNTTGWMYALEPSPELWSLAVHTRTQIVNELDASIITFNLDVFPGCVVVESGNYDTSRHRIVTDIECLSCNGCSYIGISQFVRICVDYMCKIVNSLMTGN